MHRLVDDRESQKRGQFKALQADADLGGAFPDHADVRRCGEELSEARARILTVAEAQRQRIAVQLRNSESDGGARDGGREDLT